MRKVFKDKAKESLKGRWKLIILFMFIHFLLTGWTSSSRLIELRTGKDYFLIFTLWGILLNCFLSIGKAKFLLEYTKVDGYPKINMLFSYFKIYFKTLGLSLLINIIVFIGFLLLIVPGVILGFALSQCSYILAQDPEIGIIECIKESRRIMNGRKFDFFILELSFIGWELLSILTLGIGFLFLEPYKAMTKTYFYLDAKENPNL